ncbi:hypothetical protein [Streptomyces sp. A1136]|uniref:hypothetical protein n=1 Tax=Streptomyces sp. A1136 TaxID=2563102 RepID=UPI00109EB6EE|nr:hypothetical protein [Streptomyces sp. A1136]THA57268.1 hypothetical protein E6R62_08205 [Streptomyces sp. A1136]
MRRGIIAAVVAGAAGATLGLMPVSGAFAATLPQHDQQCSDHWRGDNGRDCCDSSRWNDHDNRPDWCRNDDNGNWGNANWNDSGWRGGDHGDWSNSRNDNWSGDHGNWNGDRNHDSQDHGDWNGGSGDHGGGGR